MASLNRPRNCAPCTRAKGSALSETLLSTVDGAGDQARPGTSSHNCSATRACGSTPVHGWSGGGSWGCRSSDKQHRQTTHVVETDKGGEWHYWSMPGAFNRFRWMLLLLFQFTLFCLFRGLDNGANHKLYRC